MKLVFIVSALLMLTACVETVHKGTSSRFLVMGDSMMAIHSSTHQSIAHVLEKHLDTDVIDRSVPGAQYLYALPISGRLGLRIERQFIPGKWDWLIINGGGNDLWLACGCRRCEAQMDRLVSEDGSSGEIPKVVARARAAGTRVLYVGYLRTPRVASLIEHCKDEGDTLDTRLQRMAARDEGITFLSIADLVPEGDTSFHAPDRIHPSQKGSAAIASRILDVIAR